LWAFGLGVLAVTISVLLHLPMYWMAKDSGFMLAGMSMDRGMIFGMFLIVGGIFISAYGLLPPRLGSQIQTAARITVSAPEDARLGSTSPRSE